VLLALGLALVALGLGWLAAVAGSLSYEPLVAGMVIVGLGAGILNGETTKVGMTVIPKERSGMASGVSGTVRFTGLVIGISALGVVLYRRVDAAVGAALPQTNPLVRAALVHDIAAGHLAGAALPGHDANAIRQLASASFATGYQAVFITAAIFMLISALLTWWLVSPLETPPISRP
jgi:hypothetical protein